MLGSMMNVHYIEVTGVDFIFIVIIEGQGFVSTKTEIY